MVPDSGEDQSPFEEDGVAAEQRLGELQRHESFLELLPEPVFATDRTGQLTFVNDAFVDTFDYDCTGADAVQLSDFLVDEAVDAVIELLRELVVGDADGPVCRTLELQGVTAYGRTRTFEAAVAAFPDDDDFGGVRVRLQDVTDRKRREEVFTVMDRALRHNLRTNVAVITGYVGTLQEELDDEHLSSEHRTGLSRIDEAAEWIQKLGQSMRTLQRAVAEPHRRESIRIEDVVETAIESAQREDGAADLSVNVAVTGEFEASAAVEIAIEHVVENAIVHADREVPSVDVWVTRSPRDGWIDVHVADDGPGIPAFEREIVLGEASIDQLQHSSGIGLWLTRWIVDTVDGELDIEDNDPRGTVVTMRFPMVDAGDGGDGGA